jgi:hypothetical protein
MYDIPLTGPAYDKDNASIYRKLKAFLLNSPGYPWIKEFDHAKEGRAAYLAWMGHYNGLAKLSKRTSLVKARLHSLFYKNECSLSLETFSGMLKRSLITLSKDEDNALSRHQQVDRLLESIKMDDGELKAAKAVIHQSYADDFDGACTYFSKTVSELQWDPQV